MTLETAQTRRPRIFGGRRVFSRHRKNQKGG